MAFSFIQVPDHTETTASPPTYTSKWKAVGTSSQTFVHSYALGATPAVVATIYGTLYRQDIRVRQTAYNQFEVDVPYGTRKNASGEWTWDFDTTGGSIHITNAKAEIARYPEDTAPDQRGAIGVDGDQVNGIDITIPSMKLNVQFRHPLGVLTLAQAKFLHSITGTVNADSFLGFAPGEVLFLGARGADGTDAEVTVSYQFAMSANATGLSLGDIGGVDKDGWDYLWIKYRDTEQTTSNITRPVRVPQFVYVDRVYERISLSTALGFG